MSGRSIKALPGNLTPQQPLQKPGQIVRNVIDMDGVAAFQLPVLAQHFLCTVGHDQYRGHAELVRHDEVAREVLEHRRFRGIDRVVPQKFLIGLRRRFRLEPGGDDVEHAVEMSDEAETIQHRIDMIDRAIGQDQLAAGQSRDRFAHRRIWLQRRVVDPVHIGEIIVGAYAMLGHHAAHGGAVAAVIVLLDQPRFLKRDLQPGRRRTR